MWAAPRKDILLVICGSATSWIVKKVIRSRGGLHNRVTRQIPLRPFTLAECAQYAEYKRLGFDRALGISGILADVYSWRRHASAAGGLGAQIDLVIDRGDRMINVCEMKYASGEYSMSAEEKTNLARRIDLFREATGTRKGIMPTLVTTYGLQRNANGAIIQNVITLDDLFA